MSKSYEFKTGPFKSLTSPGPGSVEEFDAAAGAGACLAGGMDDAIYRGHIPTFWDLIEPKIAALTGEPRLVDEKATAKKRAAAKEGQDVADVKESLIQWGSRAYAKASSEVQAQLDEAAKSLASATPIDVSPSKRERGPGKVNLERADSFLERDDAGYQRAIAGLSSKVPDYILDSDPTTGRATRESLGMFVKLAMEKIAAETFA